ncbi:MULTISPECIES: hypothetical protein [unclassified Brucella]|uniref:hypothetical protein n=1 Tax=unclassified Brucella TaxID=2632610 RepID=UPI00217D0EC6|nr:MULTISPECIES: hypothetical protein [unclassified Brucella]UWF65980.1 hypothetical protein NYO63_06980 [Brucella sp. 1315]UWF69101.1 hypothetical protein NYO65_06975 [Brucella sp. 2594]
MIAPDELARRIEKSLTDSRLSQPERILRRACRLIRDNKNGAAKEADDLLSQADYDITAIELVELIGKKPWLLETLITNASQKTNGTGH